MVTSWLTQYDHRNITTICGNVNRVQHIWKISYFATFTVLSVFYTKNLPKSMKFDFFKILKKSFFWQSDWTFWRFWWVLAIFNLKRQFEASEKKPLDFECGIAQNNVILGFWQHPQLCWKSHCGYRSGYHILAGYPKHNLTKLK